MDFRFQTLDFRLKTRKLDLGSMSKVFCLVSCVLCLATAFSSSASAYMLSVGHVPPLRSGRTSLIITDLSGSGPDVKITFRDDSGREVPASPVHKLLPPRGKIEIDVESYFQTAGTITLESPSEKITGEYWQINEDGTISMLPFQRPGVSERYFVNCFRSPSCNDNYLVISDPYGSGPLVQMELYGRSGEVIKIARKLLRPHGMLVFKLDVYAAWDTLGKVSVRSFGGGIVLHHRQLCDTDSIFTVPARSPAKTLFVDDFAVGRGIKGSLIIVDARAEGPAAKIQFRDRNGAMLYELEKLLPPNGAVLIDPADYISNVPSGTMSVSTESEIIADYWQKDSQGIFDTAGIDRLGKTLLISHFIPFNNIQNLLSLLNVGQEPIKVEVQFYADSGQMLDMKELLLEPYKRIDELLENHFGGTCLGTIIVKSPKASLLVTSHIFDSGNHRHLGRVHAQVVR